MKYETKSEVCFGEAFWNPNYLTKLADLQFFIALSHCVFLFEGLYICIAKMIVEQKRTNPGTCKSRIQIRSERQITLKKRKSTVQNIRQFIQSHSFSISWSSTICTSLHVSTKQNVMTDHNITGNLRVTNDGRSSATEKEYRGH